MNPPCIPNSKPPIEEAFGAIMKDSCIICGKASSTVCISRAASTAYKDSGTAYKDSGTACEECVVWLKKNLWEKPFRAVLREGAFLFHQSMDQVSSQHTTEC